MLFVHTLARRSIESRGGSTSNRTPPRVTWLLRSIGGTRRAGRTESASAGGVEDARARSTGGPIFMWSSVSGNHPRS